MTLSGEQWLDRVFRPAVAVVNRARHDRVPIEPMRMLGGRLAEQVEALAQRRGLAGDRPSPARAGSPLQDLTWELRDEHGTAFRQTGTSTESGHYPDRRQMQWSPAPTSAQLTLLATDATGAVVLNAELPGPV